jgi:hypothetical protein
MPMIEFAFKHKLIKLQSDNYLDCSFFDNISFIYYLMVELSYLFGQFCIFADIYYNIMKIIFINTLRILMILVIMISCGVAYVVYEDTLAAWWIPVGVALIIVIATIPFYKGWIWLTTMDNKVINCCCHLVCAVLSVVFCFLGGITGSPILLPRMKRKSWYRKNMWKHTRKPVESAASLCVGWRS